MNRDALTALTITVLCAGCADRVGPTDASIDTGPPPCLVNPPAPPEIDTCGEQRDEIACRNWAQQRVYQGWVSTDCLWDAGASCVQVSTGPTYAHPDAAFACGDEPPCAPGFVCVAPAPDGPFHCACITR